MCISLHIRWVARSPAFTLASIRKKLNHSPPSKGLVHFGTKEKLNIHRKESESGLMVPESLRAECHESMRPKVTLCSACRSQIPT